MFCLSAIRITSSFMILGVFCGACVGSWRRNANCEWTQEKSARPLDLSVSSQQLHLSDDALIAEDLAIRYADDKRGHRSGNFQGDDEYHRARDVCMATLFRVIARDHGVTPVQVLEALAHRRAGFDMAVILSFFVLYGMVAAGIAGWLLHSVHLEKRPLIVAVVLTSGPVSLAGLLVGGLWSSMLESLRIGNPHLSYRGSRIPWGHHRLGLLVACAVVLWLMTLVRYRVHRLS